MPPAPLQGSTAQPQRTSRFAFDAGIDSSVGSVALDDDPLSEALRGSHFKDDPLAGSPVDDSLSAGATLCISRFARN